MIQPLLLLLLVARSEQRGPAQRRASSIRASASTGLSGSTPPGLGTYAVEMYTTPGCRYCQKAKGFLKARGVPLCEIDVSMAPEKIDEMIARSGGSSTLPQIFIGGQW
eukprot:5680965-Prymnesium_polylepis.1